MRVISGYLGGRQFDAPKGHRTHPMSEKARGGLFSALGDIEGLTVLDAFAGSGALSFEAVSRGAEHVTSIDIDKNAHQSIKANTKKLGITDKVKAIRANNTTWSDNNLDIKFDIIMCDPPFDKINPRQIQKLTKHLQKNGVFIVALGATSKQFVLEGLSAVKQKDYGDISLMFFK